jgi:hypothetical protein
VFWEFFVITTVAPFNAVYFFDAILVGKTVNQRLDYNIKTWTEPTTSNNGYLGILRLEDYLT